jgi:hypothetical protein
MPLDRLIYDHEILFNKLPLKNMGMQRSPESQFLKSPLEYPGRPILSSTSLC